MTSADRDTRGQILLTFTVQLKHVLVQMRRKVGFKPEVALRPAIGWGNLRGLMIIEGSGRRTRVSQHFALGALYAAGVASSTCGSVAHRPLTGGDPNKASADTGVGGSAALAVASVASARAGHAGEPANTVAWVLSYFETDQSLAADSLHLGYSTDGRNWARLGARGPAYQLSGIGTNHLRDPFILRKVDGSFVLLATDWTLADNDANYWRRPSSKLLVADSKDLRTFENPRLLVVSPLKGPGGGAMHAWAPEAYYDAARGDYAIVWSGNDAADRNRAYVSYTRDFETLHNPEPEVFFDPGYSIIDSTFTFWNGSTYLFYKDESDNDGGPTTGSGKDIQVARSPSESPAPGSFTRIDPSYLTRGNEQALRLFTEGAFVVKDPRHELWYLFADLFMQGGVYGAWSTNNLDAKPSTWARLTSAEFSFPKIVRHANTVRVTQAELDALVAYYADR